MSSEKVKHAFVKDRVRLCCVEFCSDVLVVQANPNRKRWVILLFSSTVFHGIDIDLSHRIQFYP